MKINVISIVILVWILVLFLISLFTHFTFLYMSFGFCLLLAVRFSFKKPDYLTAFMLGCKIAFWSYVVYMLLGIVIFRSVSVCFIVNIAGLVIIPLISGGASALFNIFPETQHNKPEFIYKNRD